VTAAAYVKHARDKKHYLGVVNDIKLTDAEIPPMRLPPVSDDALEGARPDVLVIGGGIVGCAIARELKRYQIDVLLVEKEHDVAMHASGRNDGMVHPGIDLHKGQLKKNTTTWAPYVRNGLRRPGRRSNAANNICLR
jgi:glycerol-3-phosphate dehydrogenase